MQSTRSHALQINENANFRISSMLTIEDR